MQKSDVMAALQRRPVPFEVAGITVLLKPWSVAAREDFYLWRQSHPDNIGLLARIVAASVCDESRNLVFASPDEVCDLDGAAVEAIATRVIELNGLSGGEGEAGKASSPGGPT